MGVWRAVDKRPRGRLKDEPVSLQRAKARKFSACADLFRVDSAAYSAAIDAMLAACPGMGDCFGGGGGLRARADDARAWFGEHPERDALVGEHKRLYGGSDWSDEMPLIPPCACSYLSEPVDGTVVDVLTAYRAIGFTPRTESGRCPAHISNELDFMSHCLSAGADGERAGHVAAHTFMMTHLFHWGVVFAAATCARAEEAPATFAGAILEQLLFCELEQAGREGTRRSPQSPAPV